MATHHCYNCDNCNVCAVCKCACTKSDRFTLVEFLSQEIDAQVFKDFFDPPDKNDEQKPETD